MKESYNLWKLNPTELSAFLDSILTREKTGYEYIFPLNNHDKPDHTKPFLRPIFTEILFKTYFQKAKIGTQFKSIFSVTSTVDGTQHYQMSEPLLALSATYVRFASFYILHVNGAN